ncbi:MAG: NAD-dependent epimerase/dehydratase family protein, partial [Rhodospirillales bacterium]|nr:NAD-dependent epimerase/dehydratase family protein [Rhodospirillales bacterium]
VGDIGPDTDWSVALAGADAVVHLAARVHVMRERGSASDTLHQRINVDGTRRLAEAAVSAGVKRFVFLSTVKVNGEKTCAVPFTERDLPAPQGSYGKSKWQAEQILTDLAARTGLEVVILRSPLVYGEGVKGNFLSLLRLAVVGLPLPLGHIDNRRSIIYLGNLLDIIIQCLTRREAAGQTYLVRDGEDVSTSGLIDHLGHALGRKVMLVPAPPFLLRLLGLITGRPAAAQRLLDSLVVDDGKIRRELGWTPPYTLARGLKNTAEWYLRTRRH